MNPAQTNPLERVAAQGLEQRFREQLELHKAFFAAALRDVPMELQLETELKSSSADSKLVRLEIASCPFDLETTFLHQSGQRHNLYHSGLALSAPIRELADYSRERAEAQHRSSVSWLLAQVTKQTVIGLIAAGLVTWLIATVSHSSPGHTIALMMLTCALQTAMIARGLIDGQPRAYRALFPPVQGAVSAAMREGFERWQQATFETTAALTTAFETKERK